MSEEVTWNDTKSKIWNALKEAKAERDELRDKMINADSDQKFQKDMLSVQHADALIENDVVERQFEEIKVIHEKLMDMMDEYNDLKRAKQSKEKELEELTGFEKQWLNTADLLDAKAIAIRDMKRNYEIQQEELRRQLGQLEKDYDEKNRALQKELDNKKTEFDYEFETHKKKEYDDLNRNLEEKKYFAEKDLRDKYSRFREERKEYEEDMERLEELQIQVDGFPEVVREEVDKAVSDAKASAEKSKNIALQLQKGEFEKRIERTEAELQSYVRHSETLQVQLDKAHKTIDELMTKVERMATSVVSRDHSREMEQFVREYSNRDQNKK